MPFWRSRALLSALVAISVGWPSASAQAHHDGGSQLPVSLNVPGTVGGISNPGGLTKTTFGLSSRVFRVSGHPLYSSFMGGDATVLMNALHGTVGITPKLALQAMIPLVTDLPEGASSSHTGLGDMQLGLRWFALNDVTDYVWSVAAETSAPTGNEEYGFGAGTFVSRASTRLSYDFVDKRVRVFVEAGTAWAWAQKRGTMADVALASVWQTTRLVGLFVEARVLTAIESGRLEPVNFGGRTRAAGNTTVILTPAFSLAVGEHASAAAGPQIPLGFKDFDLGFAVSLTYRK